jgi:hypothetical protein
MAVDRAAKAEYDRARRVAKAAELRAYDNERNAVRRKDPAYAAAQVERKRSWRARNQDHHRAMTRAYDAKQLAENPQRRIAKNLRHRICKAMLGKTRGVSAVGDLGISIPEFRAYIAGKFTSGMSWDNYGEWHLDHIKPLKSFDLTDVEQAKAAVHFSNYQPLWALDNQRKWCKP